MDINEIQNIVEDDGIIFLTYGGFLSQSLIASMTEALEKEAESNDLKMTIANNIFTIFIYLAFSASQSVPSPQLPILQSIFYFIIF